MTTDANSILMGSGAPSAKFERAGDIVTGRIVREPEARQQTEFRTGVPLTWKDGSPKMQVVVQLATQQRDAGRPDDDGTRTLFIKGKELTNAIRQAVRQAGADGLRPGGELTITYTGDGRAENGLNPPKLYTASYQPPVGANGLDFSGLGVASAPPAAAQDAPPAGVPADMWARLDATQRDALRAAAAATQANTPPF